MDQLVGFLLHPPLSEIGRKMLKCTPHFQSAFGTAAHRGMNIIICAYVYAYNMPAISFRFHSTPALHPPLISHS